jgi:archaellum biogenesis protein FlaJ (TadC family)
MRTWVTEGRVSADSLVWREGWRDWQEAAVVFPKLRANQFMDFLDATPAAAAAPASSPTATHVDPTKERTKIDRTFILLIFLSVVAVILVLTLVFVILYYK